MKIDKTTYRDKEENQIGMTANHTSRPDVFYFLPTAHFLKQLPTHNGTFESPTNQRCKQSFVKECNLAYPPLHVENFLIKKIDYQLIFS